MSALERLRQARSVRWSPEQMPRSLKYSELDYERTDLITTVGGNISAFIDPVTGASWTQATSGSRPALNATGFNGRPCGVYDGSDDFLRNTTALATLGWPTSGAFEIWSLVELNNSTTTGTWFSYPVGGNTGLALQAPVPGTRRIRAAVGLGASTVTIDVPIDATSRRLVRFVSDGANCRLDVDGVAGTPVAAAASFSSGPRNTMGASAGVTPNNYLDGKISFLGFYKPLPTSFANDLTAHLLLRKG